MFGIDKIVREIQEVKIKLIEIDQKADAIRQLALLFVEKTNERNLNSPNHLGHIATTLDKILDKLSQSQKLGNNL